MAQRTRDDVAAVVTGHTRGLGAAIAEHLLSRDVRVFAIGRRRNAELVARYGDALIQVELDLADPAALTAWLHSEVLGRFLRHSQTALLVNNAGVVQPVGPLDTQDITIIARAVVVNVAAPLALSGAFVAATRDARDRRILHISSGAGRQAYSGWSVYCATKAALDHHARAVALDRTPALRIASVAPGVIDTDMQAAIRATTERNFPDRQRFVSMKREGQLLSPERAGQAVVEFLLSEAFGGEPVTDLRYVGP
ncbi:MAG: SDR family oxidoreductase [Gemmatimonadota bacterium]|nr:SDR family oxidoreductase [Gemmatimonadota bacterium]